ncbi:MAG: hypothetical protein HFJ94_04770 [Muribaculaceae bacterium]|nr:hypothetical protein [Muribaculaceae bacterium]
MRGKSDSSPRIIDLWRFKSDKTNRVYIVKLEHFAQNLKAIKFYPKDFRHSDNKYKILTNDYEPRKIVFSCFEIMRRTWEKDKTVSFGFVAASDMEESKKTRGYNRRFRLYKALVMRYFGYDTFTQIHDNDRVYLMLNNDMIASGKLSIDEMIENVNKIFGEELNFSWD